METERGARHADTLTARFYSSSLRTVHQTGSEDLCTGLKNQLIILPSICKHAAALAV